MGITTSTSGQAGHSLSSRTKCWDCNRTSAAFRIDPNSGREICIDCSRRKGLDLPIESSDEPIGTVEPAKSRESV